MGAKFAVLEQPGNYKHDCCCTDPLEVERERLHLLAATYGIASPQVLRQSRIVDMIIAAIMKKKSSSLYLLKKS